MQFYCKWVAGPGQGQFLVRPFPAFVLGDVEPWKRFFAGAKQVAEKGLPGANERWELLQGLKPDSFCWHYWPG
jgi:hypothetical protein